MTAPRTGLEVIAAGRRRQALTDGATPTGDQQYATGQLAAAARCYLSAANAVTGTRRWAAGDGRRLADTLDGGIHRKEIREDLERATADPVGWHYGRDADGNVKLPSDDWPLDPALWHPTNEPLANLAQAGALVTREIDRLLALAGDTDAPAPAAAPSGRHWVIPTSGEPYWADQDGGPLATVEVYWVESSPSDRVGPARARGEAVQAEAEAELRHALRLSVAAGQPGVQVLVPAPPGSHCESCGKPADVRLPDGSDWCASCDESARRLGYDAAGNEDPDPEDQDHQEVDGDE